jgi:hypothetical protein
MKTELEQLKENAERQRQKEVRDELIKYLDTRIEIQRNTFKRLEKNMLWMGLAMVAMVVTIFTGPGWLNTILIVTMWYFIYRQFAVLDPIMNKADSESTGLMDCLVILGMAEYKPPSDRGKKKRKRLLKRQTIAERWELLKKKLRREAYV